MDISFKHAVLITVGLAAVVVYVFGKVLDSILNTV